VSWTGGPRVRVPARMNGSVGARNKGDRNMARRYGFPLYGARYCGNTNPTQREVHDLDNEKAQCQIDRIIGAGHAKPYQTLQQALNEGFDRCAWCLGGSLR
jgi:hypothetical protein